MCDSEQFRIYYEKTLLIILFLNLSALLLQKFSVFWKKQTSYFEDLRTYLLQNIFVDILLTKE